MSDSSLSGIKLAAIVAAAALLFGNAAVLSVPGGVTLLLILFAFNQGPKTAAQSAAFACAGAFAVSAACRPFLPSAFVLLDFGFSSIYAVWLLAAVVLFFVDRARTGSAPMPYASTTAYQPPPPPPPSTVYEPPPAAPVRTHLVQQPILVRDEAPVVTPVEPLPTPALVSAAAPVPGAMPLKGGKLVEIYVNLLGEGMNMLRSVRAESLGRDYYHIMDTMPENERWEFQPGQVVRCQKKNLSSGKAMVAVEEAPRAAVK